MKIQQDGTENSGENKERDESVLNPQKIHESDLTKKERRLLEKEKLKGMGLRKKLEYIWMYYKPVIFGVIFGIVLIFVGVDMYQNAKTETKLSISLVNAGDFNADQLTQDIRELLGATGKYETVSIGANLVTNADGSDFDYYARMAYITQLQTTAMDVMVIPETLYDTLKRDEVFADLSGLLGEETFMSMGGGEDKNHLELKGSSLKETLDIIYDPVIVVLENSGNKENAAKWIASLAN